MKTRSKRKTIDFVDAIRESGNVEQKEVLPVGDDDDDDEDEFEDESDIDSDEDLADDGETSTSRKAGGGNLDAKTKGGNGDDSSDDDDERHPRNDVNGKYLPGASASWGRNPAAYYNTDYVDQDFGGFGSGSEEETAQLEEETAVEMQRQLAERVKRLEDYGLDEVMGEVVDDRLEEDKMDETKVTKKVDKKGVTAMDESELRGIVEEYNEKLTELKSRIQPVITGISSFGEDVDSKLAKSDRFCPLKLKLLQTKYEIYANYLININYYLVLRASSVDPKMAASHPCIDRIINWRKLITVFDSLPEVDLINAVILKSSEILENSTDSSKILMTKLFDCSVKIQKTNELNIQTQMNLSKLGKGVSPELGMVMENGDVDPGVDGEELSAEAEAEEMGKRGLTYTMSKNKGILPKRKKEQRNPRVKHKLRYRKALIRKRSQMPDVRTEMRKYDGEARGIKTHVVRRVQLKG